MRVESYVVLPSTQDAVRERLLRGDEVDGLVIRADVQSRGRGQRARAWSSPAGGSYQTLCVRDPAPPRLAQGVVAVAVALGLAETFREHGLRVGIKWPNDLYYRGRKLAGILTEYRRAHLMIGVGVNVDNPVPAEGIGLQGWPLERVHALVLEGLQRGLRGIDTEIPTRFSPFDLLRDRRVSASVSGETLHGTARGVDEVGRLLLAAEDRSLVPVTGGLRGYTLRDLE